jgi:hypothetical protein
MDKRDKRAIFVMDNKCCCNLLLTLALGDIDRENDSVVATLAEHCADAIDETRARRLGAYVAPAASEGAACASGGGTFCGALAAAVAVLYLAQDYERAADSQDELMDWFSESFGSYDCKSFAQNMNAVREELCPKIILATYLQLRNYIDPDNHLSQKTLL